MSKIGSLCNRLAATVLKLDEIEGDFRRRKFRRGDPATEAHLQTIARTFIGGYNSAIAGDCVELEDYLQTIPTGRRGFAVEGASMAIMLTDVLSPWRPGRWQRLVASCLEGHVYLAYVGAGWTMARLGVVKPTFARLDPLRRWLIFDGRGFHDGFFSPTRTIGSQHRPKMSPSEAAVYDQGVGRALWFTECADPDGIHQSISRFKPARHADLWAGVGLAATYAGGVASSVLLELKMRAGPYASNLAQGSAFAATALVGAEAVTPECDSTVQMFCGCMPLEAARTVEQAATQVIDRSSDAAYFSWRECVRKLLSERAALAI